MGGEKSLPFFSTVENKWKSVRRTATEVDLN